MSVTERKSILRRTPYRDRRSFVTRAMGLSPIGDIASGGLSTGTAETITWETATDWDNAPSEYGVAHENTANSDYNDATVVRKGNPLASPAVAPSSLELYYPLHEDSGSTAYDFSGNNRDGTYNNSPTLGSTGIVGTTAPDFEHDNSEYINVGVSPSLSGQITISHFGKYESFTGGGSYNSDPVGGGFDGSTTAFQSRFHNSFGWDVGSFDGSEHHATYSLSNLSTGTWYHFCGLYDGSAWRLYLDGTEVASSTDSQGAIDNTVNWGVGAVNTGSWGNFIDGVQAETRIYSTGLSASQVSTLYDAVAGTSTLTVPTKSFSSPTKPNLQNLSYTLNGQSATLDVIGSPGTASEETVSQTLDGATSYDLTWSNSHTDFRVQLNLSNSTFTDTPTINRVELVTP